MLTQEECDIMNGQMYHTMVEALGIKFLPSDDDIAWAEMPINETTRQYFGILHGGASLALAETIAGAGSLHLVEGKKKICGMQVTGNHIGMSIIRKTKCSRFFERIVLFSKTKRSSGGFSTPLPTPIFQGRSNAIPTTF